MKKNYIKKRKKMSRKMSITIAIVAIVFVSLAFIGKYFAVDFIFDNYIVKPALEVVKDGGIAGLMEQGEENTDENTPKTEEGVSPETQMADETGKTTDNQPSESVQQNTQQETTAKKELSTAEIAYKVLASPDLMARLEGMVSNADKSAVISIAKSCFTNDEKKYYLAEIAKSGLTSQIKSEMMGIVRSRMTDSKKASVLSLFSKYAEQLRPYVQ